MSIEGDKNPNNLNDQLNGTPFADLILGQRQRWSIWLRWQ